MKIKYLLVLLILSINFNGCVPEIEYFWGNYSKTLYALKKTPNDKTLVEHKNSLIEIIKVSNSKKKRVPPGVYAEYGYILLKEGKEIEGLESFNKELIYYPESKVFIEKLKTSIQKEGLK